MALIVEDGSGKSDAESYITVAAADARHTALGNAAWTGTDAVKEAALRKGAEYLEQRYSQRWRGTKLLRAQALSWPRYGAIVHGWDVDSDIVPAAVANACADLALKALSATLNADQERGIREEQVGPVRTVFDTYSPQSNRYPAIDQMLAPYLSGLNKLARR